MTLGRLGAHADPAVKHDTIFIKGHIGNQISNRNTSNIIICMQPAPWHITKPHHVGRLGHRLRNCMHVYLTQVVLLGDS